MRTQPLTVSRASGVRSRAKNRIFSTAKGHAGAIALDRPIKGSVGRGRRRRRSAEHQSFVSANRIIRDYWLSGTRTAGDALPSGLSRMGSLPLRVSRFEEIATRRIRLCRRPVRAY